MGDRTQPEIRQHLIQKRSRSGRGGDDLASAAAVGSMLRTARETLGLSQHQVADLTVERGLPVSRSAVCDIERGCNMPGIESLVSLCEVLHVDPFEVLEQVRLPSKTDGDLMKFPVEELQRKGTLLIRVGQYRAALAVFAAMAEQVDLGRSGVLAERRRLRTQIEIWRSFALRKCGDFRRAEVAAKRAIHDAATDDLLVSGLLMLASVHSDEGVPALALAESERALATARLGGCPSVVAWGLNSRGRVLSQYAEFGEAHECFIRARDLSIETDAKDNLATYEGNLAGSLLELGHFAAARRHYAKAVARAREIHDRPTEASWQIEIGVLALRSEELDEAERRAAAALRLARAADNPLTLFRGIWLQHRIVKRRDRRDPDRQRVGYLKRLFPRVARHNGIDKVREFRREILRATDA